MAAEQIGGGMQAVHRGDGLPCLGVGRQRRVGGEQETGRVEPARPDGMIDPAGAAAGIGRVDDTAWSARIVTVYVSVASVMGSLRDRCSHPRLVVDSRIETRRNRPV